MSRAPVGRHQLLHAAREELIRTDGSLELAALTRRSGLSTGALYHHFGSKSGLLAAVYDSFYLGLRHATADSHLDPSDWFGRERQRTALFVSYHFDEPLARVLLSRTANDLDLAEIESAHLDFLIAEGIKNLRHGQDAGEIRVDLDAPSTSAFIIGGLRFGIAQQLAMTPAPPVHLVVERMWGLTERAIRGS